MFDFIPVEAVALLGAGATLKYGYQLLYQKNYKNAGSFASMLYLTITYILLYLNPPWLIYHGESLVRLGIVCLFSDKIFVFTYDLLLRRLIKKRCRLVKNLLSGE